MEFLKAYLSPFGVITFIIGNQATLNNLFQVIPLLPGSELLQTSLAAVCAAYATILAYFLRKTLHRWTNEKCVIYSLICFMLSMFFLVCYYFLKEQISNQIFVSASLIGIYILISFFSTISFAILTVRKYTISIDDQQ